MKNITRKVFSFGIAMLILVSIFGVNILNNDVYAQSRKLKIVFDIGVDGTEPVTKIALQSTKVVVPPEVPANGSKIFRGWRYNDAIIDFSKEIKYFDNVKRWRLSTTEGDYKFVDGQRLLPEVKVHAVWQETNTSLEVTFSPEFEREETLEFILANQDTYKQLIDPIGKLLVEPQEPKPPLLKVFKGWQYNGKLIDFNQEVKYLPEKDKWLLMAQDGTRLFTPKANRTPISITLVPRWEEINLQFLKVKVTFDTAGGFPSVPTQEINVNSKAVMPKVRLIGPASMEFDAWYLGDEKFDFNTPVSSDITLTAHYKARALPALFNVEFDTDRGQPAPMKQAVRQGSHAKKPDEVPQKDGYVFDGWFLGDEKFDFNTPVSSNITLIAHYNPRALPALFNVEFDTDGGQPAPMTQAVRQGSHARKPDVDPQKDGYVFDGWFLGDTGNAMDFENYAINANTTVTAKYHEIPTFQIIFSPHVGNLPVSMTVVELGDKVVKPSIEPEKEGYKFIGWYKGEEKYDFDTPVTESFTLEAKFEELNEDPTNDSKVKRDDLKINDADYDKAIMQYKKPFFTGYPDGSFKPENTITRAEIATVFVRVLGLENRRVGGTVSFSDIEGHWAKDNILKLAEYGLINGYPDGTFKPNGEITRAEITAMISKYWKLKDFEADTSSAAIADINSHWAKEFITALYNHGIVDIDDISHKFFPDEKLQRCDVALIFNRITDRVAVNSSVRFIDVPKGYKLYDEINTAASESSEVN